MIATRTRLRVAVMVVTAALMACSQTPATPSAPDWLELPAKYPWGDQVAGREGRLARHVDSALGKQFGKADETHAVAADAAQLRRLQDWYRGKLPGWTERNVSMSAGETAISWSNGDQAVVVAALAAQPDGRVPVTIFRFGNSSSR